MKKIIYILSFMAIGILSSCTKDFEEINTNPAQFLTPDAEPVFSSTVKRTADLMGNNNVDFLWEYSHIINKSGRYNGGNDTYWQQTYVEVLGNLKQLRELYKNNPGYANRIQILNIWECYVYAMMVGTYGPVPYSKALEMTPSVGYDDENSIYASLLTRLKAASDAIVVTGDKFSPDILYGGDLTKWKKFANSLRLRLALTVQLNIPA
ncbi:SusD/RagB family nutrient-binding outer membrane lipoprotein, partial [Pedobacter sp. UBA5917]|uniref:SusD/RagB family nutrient-binding outer membrane lipoprotein n=1 Tax=Pedobacter sp. UBA5917 TaxID=1947061 RepID=UPI0025F417CD